MAAFFLQSADKEELVCHLVHIMVRGIATLKLPAAFLFEGVKHGHKQLSLPNFLIGEVSGKLAAPVGRVLYTIEGKLRLCCVCCGANGGKNRVKLLNGILLDRTNDRDLRWVDGDVDDEVLIRAGHLL